MSGRIVIRPDSGGSFRFNLLDEDSTVLMSSKGFDSKDAARAGVDRALSLLDDIEVIDQTEGENPVRSTPSVADPDAD
jgi:uncharacterized protein YegP (UPF0339 family)